jgi:hypothetical protein
MPWGRVGGLCGTPCCRCAYGCAALAWGRKTPDDLTGRILYNLTWAPEADAFAQLANANEEMTPGTTPGPRGIAAGQQRTTSPDQQGKCRELCGYIGGFRINGARA